MKAKPEWIQKVPGLNSYQDLLIDKVPASWSFGVLGFGTSSRCDSMAFRMMTGMSCEGS